MRACFQGILAEILEPIMGKGLIPADNETWKVRRRAIVPAFHQKWLEHMIGWVRPGRQAGRQGEMDRNRIWCGPQHRRLTPKKNPAN